MAESPPAPALAEMQGLYGPYTISERILQKIWLRGDFRSADLRTVSGKTLRLRHPGRWNLQEGPDFRGAEWELDGCRVRGDVEVHFHSRDWAAHGHDLDPRYAGVALHVVLFPPTASEPAPRTLPGEHPEQLVLLDRLERDLEDYAADEALLAAEGRDPLGPLEDFLRRPPADRRARLGDCALHRWRQKRAFAAQRLARDGWAEACHQLTLEALGFRRNRAPMAALALKYPLATWPAHAPAPATLYDEERSRWKLAGLRPANHPRRRLEQYARVVAANPHWPASLKKLAADFPEGAAALEGSATFRRRFKLTDLRARIAKEIFADAWHGARLDTLIGDVLLPLAAAHAGREFFALWFHGFPGDAPLAFAKFLRQADLLDRRDQPLSHGLLQAALQIFLEGAG
ncbi:MAG: DUF2851 family protein [Opitutales bacterium]